MAVDKNKFKTVTQFVIDKLEGGYYNPSWHSVGDSRYSASGETMFGIDRKAGGKINDTTAGKEFWGIIDKAKTPQTWKWNYKGGALAPQLKDLVVDIMYPVYERNAKNYLTAQAKAIVDSDSRLLFHFIYGSWNGAGWFKKFATDMNKAVASGITDPDKLSQVALDSRTKEGLKEGSSPNSLIAQGGRKIATLFGTLKDATISTAKATEEVVKKNPLPIAIMTSLLLVSGYFLYTYGIKNKIK
jgi:hypothetical protein